ncbi:DEAD box-containing helicase-like transcription factor/DNA repair protein [Macrophomina phaseolina]|uniref:DEAD box-containing helicase-like transcription factor/DNA repair protein n=1 Tax=Macrophomina phaseolina TaxID=35725 RepID=A0ABQ8GQH0_9PEZI|nr:DEAD box-containing helicase-like transcription factor/DNA repair protein [Macrophomina phaseolina]
MFHVATEVQLVEYASQEHAASPSPLAFAAALRDYCWPPPRDDRSDAGEPPNKRRRISTDGLEAHDGTASAQGKYISLSKIRFELVFQDGQRNHDVFASITQPMSDLHLKSIELVSSSLLELTLVNEGASTDLCLSLVPQQPLESLTAHLDFISRFTNVQTAYKRKKAEAQVLSTHVTMFPGSSHTSNPALVIQLLWATGVEGEDRIRSNSAFTALEKEVLSYFFPQSHEPDAPWNIQTFYESVRVPPKEGLETPEIPKDLLTCTLYPFQRRSVQWLLQREGAQLREGNVVQLSDQCQLPPSFEAAKDSDNQSLFISHLRRMVVRDLSAVSDNETGARRGILAEEMGLGKTVELTALISLHRRKLEQEIVHDPYLGTDVLASGATLIITPPGILEQWKTELNTHAPQLRVFHYKGLPPITATKRQKDLDLVQELRGYDVVLTTYHVLSREIHYANAVPKRDLRKAKQYEPRRSPLVQISWWRCCLDEAQMIESGVSQAATVARVIPRVNAWAVSGTPVKKNVQDLLGLLVFLRLEPFCSSKLLWNRLDRKAFRDIFSTLALRHTKDEVRDELRLPPQKRIVMLVPFTSIEEQNYSQLVQQLCDDCGLSPEGLPIEDGFDMEDPRIVEKMRGWLTRLRQTCLHPQVGGRNRRALGRGKAPLRTVQEVLDVMIEQNDTLVRAEERENVLARVVRGHILGFAKNDPERSHKALAIYKDALKQAEGFVEDARRDLADEEARLEANGSGRKSKPETDLKGESEDESDSDGDDLDGKRSGRAAIFRKALRSALEVQHICTFYVASAYFQIKTNEELTKLESDEFRKLDQLETSFYEKAKAIRKELLLESHSRAERVMRKLKARAKLAVAEISMFEDYGGIESRRVLEKMDRLTEKLNNQGKQLNEWREQAVRILLMPLVDEGDEETTGEEYEASTKAQDELQVYITMLRAIIADRHRLLTGQSNYLVDEETKTAQKQAKEGAGPAPELLLGLAAKRDRLKPTDADGSLRGIIAEVRSLATSLQWSSDGRNQRATAELHIAEKQLENTGKAFNTETKGISELEKELETYRTCMNLRVDYYRQLQVISDQLQPYKEELDEELDQGALQAQEQKEQKAADRLATLKTKQRFLLHLKEESNVQEGPRLCVICQSDFDLGVLTVCGHQYCKECFTIWSKQHHSCPLCKRRLNLNRDFHEITYKPKELRAQEEHQTTPVSDGDSTPSSGSSSIYTEISQSTMNDIKTIDLNGSFGTKIDTLARHMLWIREHDPGSKSVVFSQYGDFLKVLGDAFRQFKIGFSNIAEKGSIQNFKQDPSVECFLLDAKADASGLNLVNASYVFLMEPLINAAIELQAIARIHRIGQQRPTTVFMYLTADTVEENIYEISVQRRLEHMAGQIKGKSRSGSSTPVLQERALDAANSLEMQQAPISKLLVQKKGGGEVVSKDDVWSCLFGGEGRQRRAKGVSATSEVEVEVGRFLRAEAAEDRGRA